MKPQTPNRGTFATNLISAGNTNWTNTNNFHRNFPSLRLSQRLFTEIQKHHQTQSYMLQTVHPPPPFHKNYRQAFRRRNRRSREKKRHRHCLYGHRAADCGTSLPRQDNQYTQNTGDTTLKFIKKKTMLTARRLSAKYPQDNYKTRTRLQ